MSGIVIFTHCDECGRKMKKAQRVYKKIRYCTTCYARIFKRKLCPKCRNYARLPKHDASAVCRKCEMDRPCIRCGKKEYNTGKITPYGPVCNSCAPHFNEPIPCPSCGKPTKRLTRVKRLNIDVPVCLKCASQDYGTCQACRRHRPLHSSPDGKHLCKKCLTNGEIPCPACGKLMPAGKGNMCDECYWQNTIRKRLKMDLAAFAVPGIANAFHEFGEWLLKEVGSHKAALTIHRYLPFFMEIEKQWKSIPAYPDLLARFSAEGLRRVRLPMRWLREACDIQADTIAREEDSDRRRIEAIMASIITGTPAGKALRCYRNILTDRVNAQKTKLRSVRLALTPAASLLIATDETGTTLPTQKSLDQYLRKSPGQKSAITGFINYLNRTYSLNLVLKIEEKRAAKMRRKRLETELITLLGEINDSDEFQRRWISTALAYFHRLPKDTGTKLRDEHISINENGGFFVVWKDQQYWIPSWNMTI